VEEQEKWSQKVKKKKKNLTSHWDTWTCSTTVWQGSLIFVYYFMLFLIVDKIQNLLYIIYMFISL